MPPYAYRMDNRSRLIRAATELFEKQGFAGTTVEDLLVATGVARSNFYYHFDDKLDLARAVLERWVEACERELGADSRSEPERIEDLFRLVLEEGGAGSGNGSGDVDEDVHRLAPSLGALALELAPHDEEIHDLLVRFLKVLESRLQAAIEEPGREREALSGRRAVTAAKTAVATLEGALVLRRACGSSTFPREARDGFLELLRQDADG